MGDEEPFVRAILAAPSDDSPRLIYADWLEERGDLRGEFLRTQTTLARMPKKDKRRTSFGKRLKALRPSIDSEWLALFDFTLRYQTAFAALARPLRPRDGVPEGRVARGERRLGIRLPRALRNYYLVAGRLDQFNVDVHDHLMPPESWELDSGIVEFLDENQGVARWGVKADDPVGDDPPVFHTYYGEPMDWNKIHPRCSEFLVTHLYLHAVWGGMKYLGKATDIGQAEVTQALAKLEKTWPFVGEDSDLLAFGKDGQAACVVPSLGLYVGGREREDYDAVVAEFSGIGVLIKEGRW
jgi:uncharacterized protein (TIGR02996 family)